MKLSAKDKSKRMFRSLPSLGVPGPPGRLLDGFFLFAALLFPESPDSLANVFPDIYIEKIDITDMIVFGEIEKAPREFWFFYIEQAAAYMSISGFLIDFIETC